MSASRWVDPVRSAGSAAALCMLSMLAFQAHAGSAEDDVANQLVNPVANLTSIPFQFKVEKGAGANGEGERSVLNIQPVIPVPAGANWTFVSRTIIPVIDQKRTVSDRRQTGIGDIQQSVLLSPRAVSAGGWLWGAGFEVIAPTASNDSLGSSTWSLGPTAAALRQTPSGWTYGALTNHVFSLRADDTVNATFLEPFVARRVGPGMTVSFNSESTYDWHAHSWDVPLGMAMSQVITIDHQLFSFQIGVVRHLTTPAGGPDWGLSATLTLLFPRVRPS